MSTLTDNNAASTQVVEKDYFADTLDKMYEVGIDHALAIVDTERLIHGSETINPILTSIIKKLKALKK